MRAGDKIGRTRTLQSHHTINQTVLARLSNGYTARCGFKRTLHGRNPPLIGPPFRAYSTGPVDSVSVGQCSAGKLVQYATHLGSISANRLE